MTPWLLNLVRFCKHNDDAKRQRVTAILDKLITMTINEKQMYPSIQAKIWGSLGQVGPVSGPRPCYHSRCRLEAWQKHFFPSVVPLSLICLLLSC